MPTLFSNFPFYPGQNSEAAHPACCERRLFGDPPTAIHLAGSGIANLQFAYMFGSKRTAVFSQPYSIRFAVRIWKTVSCHASIPRKRNVKQQHQQYVQ